MKSLHSLLSFVITVRRISMFGLLLMLAPIWRIYAQETDHQVTVTVDYNPTSTFSQYKTYSFDVAKLMTDEGLMDLTKDLPAKKRIEDAISAQLNKKGLRPYKGNAHPDLHVVYLGGVKDKAQAEAAGRSDAYANWAPRKWFTDSWNEWWTTEHKEGTLIVDLLDAKTDAMIWRAYILSSDVQHGEDCCPDLNEAMERAFSQYPPKGIHKKSTAAKANP